MTTRIAPFIGSNVETMKAVYTVVEVAALMGLSRQSVSRLFERERGVLILGRPESMHKWGFSSLRIPRAVYERVIARLTVKKPGQPTSSFSPITVRNGTAHNHDTIIHHSLNCRNGFRLMWTRPNDDTRYQPPLWSSAPQVERDIGNHH